eukprot:CAMPEP_0202916196 /NCGR_PEP_ID=MMETSP1392-20130828/67932_1 /ASSEMBLY_ACC=CAM_ASM_000868 /TAXON_ID=225041 /ORGANISM="Chlamydomonas chlamydogama, Strain SAG 11-48b" /LENGTH=70 /DNA_ID=CAMNT_0049608525 /DNA_START=97 /DNA_END=309 /DNA_ORIENTATION=-
MGHHGACASWKKTCHTTRHCPKVDRHQRRSQGRRHQGTKGDLRVRLDLRCQKYGGEASMRYGGETSMRCG